MTDRQPRKPWVGDRWEETGLLILGESHYSDGDPEDPEMTRSVVSDVTKGYRLRFFTSVERAVTGCASGQTQPANFWHSVAFANFRPGAAPSRDIKATAEMIERGVKALPAMLENLKPRRLLYVSKKCWDATEHLEGMTWAATETFSHDGHEQETGFLGTVNHQPGAFSIYIKHPAFGWSADWWHAFVKDFLARPL